MLNGLTDEAGPDIVQEAIAAGFQAGGRAAEAERASAREPLSGQSSGFTKAPAGGDHTAVTRCLADVTPEPIKWLWHRRVALGKPNLVAGQPGGGKFQLTIAMAATVSTGSNWPDGASCPQGSIIFISCEDGVGDTIVPRLMAAGADLNRVHVLDWVRKPAPDGQSFEQHLFNLSQDVQTLQALVEELGDVSLIVIDPISAYVGGIDSHKASDVRGALAPLQNSGSRNRRGRRAGGSPQQGQRRWLCDGACRRLGCIRCRLPLCMASRGGPPRRRAQAPHTHAAQKQHRRRQNGLCIFDPVCIWRGIETSRVVFEPDPVVVSASELLRGQQQTDEERGALEEALDFLREFKRSDRVSILSIPNVDWPRRRTRRN